MSYKCESHPPPENQFFDGIGSHFSQETDACRELKILKNSGSGIDFVLGSSLTPILRINSRTELILIRN
jgi:hypothetical protein